MTVPKLKGKVRVKGKNNVRDGNIKTRKELRKERRQGKKLRKHEFFSRKKGNKVPKTVTNKVGNSNVPLSKLDSINMQPSQHKTHDGFIKHQLREKEKQLMRQEKLKKEMDKTRQKQLKQANREEDKVIKKLEKQLKLNKRKSKSVPKSFASDGLDYLLEVCDEEKMKQAVKLEQYLQESGSEIEEDFAMVTGKSKKRHLPADGNNGVGSEVEEDIGSDENIDSENDTLNSVNGEGSIYGDRDENSTSDLHKESSVESDGSPEIIQRDINTKKRSFSSLEDEENSRSKKSKPISQALGNKKKTTNKSASNHGNASTAANTAYNMDSDPNQSGKFVRLRNKNIEDTNYSFKTEDLLVSDHSFGGSEGSAEGDFENGENDKEPGKEELWEDIYGRTRDKKGNVIQSPAGKYIPPQLRVQANAGDIKKREQLQRLRKQMKGHLNRLAENNMNSIAIQFDELYMNNSRNDMNDTLTSLMMESLVAPVLTPERLIMEHCMLIAILHGNVGSEIGAHFLQVVVKRFNELLGENCEVEDKQLDNLVLIISHLYNFKLFHSLLMYNILNKLAETFGPKEVELILLVLRSVGFSLRKDDPIALKSLVVRLQQKASKASQLQSDSRVNFMLDILLAIKNNNMAKIPNYDPSHSEHLKRLMKGFLRKGNYITELKISLEDLLKAEERGRWWVVGSAWSGVLPGENQSEQKGELPERVSLPSQQYSQQLLDLARKQRMNTDVRRNIFCILMTADDYLDAFEKLLHLGLKNQQEREIIHVILDCCLHEKEFNPYYGHLTQKFCSFDRKYHMILQYSLWDKFREVQNLSPPQIRNLARLLVLLFVEKGLPISVLKVIHFSEVDKATVRLLRQILLGVLLHESQEQMQEVFQRVAAAPKLHMFRESIRLFIKHFLLRKTDSLPAQDVETLKNRANVVDNILSVVDSRSRLF